MSQEHVSSVMVESQTRPEIHHSHANLKAPVSDATSSPAADTGRATVSHFSSQIERFSGFRVVSRKNPRS